MNERDSEIIEHLLVPSGFIPVFDIDSADLIILNTCSIRAKAEQKVYSMLGQLRQQKNRNPHLLIGVTGCVAQQEGKRIQQKMPHVDMVVGTQQIYQIPDLVDRLTAHPGTLKPEIRLSTAFAIPPFQNLLYDNTNTSQADASPALPDFKKFVTIMQGCNNYCSYCVVPFTRGREISRPLADIIEEVTLLVTGGVKEITLLGQNVNSYGQTNAVADTPVHFADLLRRVSKIEGIRRLRFTTSNPKDLSDELMRCFAEIEILCPQFHLPVQSGSDRILKRMNRKYTISSYLGQVERLLKYQPELALSTDIIVGFPGESEEDFTGTMELLEIVRFHSSFSFKYSDRPGTRSADFTDKVAEDVKSVRLQRFQERQDQISLERNREYLARALDVIVEGIGKNDLLYGRTTTNHIVHFPAVPGRSLDRGDEIRVKINQAGQHSLTGNVIEKGNNHD